MSLPSPAAPTGNRFVSVSPDDHGAPILIASVLSLIFALLVLAVRLTVVKWGSYGLDDVVLVGAHAISVGQWAAIFIAFDTGLGKATSSEDVGQLTSTNKAVYASRILLILALCLSKCAILLIIRSLFTRDLKVRWRVSNVAIAIVCGWGVASVLTVSIACSPNSILLDQGKAECANQVLRLRGIMISDALIEAGIVILTAAFLRGINMTFKPKLRVVIAFSFRLPAAVCSIAYLVSYTQFLQSPGTGVNVAPPMIWQQVLLGYSLMSVTIPCLKGFLSGFTTGGMGYTKHISTTTSQQSKQSQQSSF